MLAPTGPVLELPLAGRLPLHPPEAVHVVALVELHVSVEVPPEATLVGEALKLAVGTGTGTGAGTDVTATEVVAAGLVPPGPKQVRKKAELAVNAPVLIEPAAASAPLQAPEAVHEVACAEVQVSIDALPAVTEAGFAVSVAVGGSLTMIATEAIELEPRLPMQVNENVVSLPSAPVLRLPEAANVPLHPPEAVQDVA